MTTVAINRRYLWIGGIFLIIVGLLVFTAAPAANRLNSGSTWSHSPDGYGAWYAHMIEQGAPIQRWQRPLSELLEQVEQEQESTPPTTLLQIYPGFATREQQMFSHSWQQDWLKAGNRIIVLGLREPVTAAPFTTLQTSADGAVKVETRRRLETSKQWQVLLGDDYGAVVGQPPQDSGEMVLGVSPFLAANAYQQEAGNFAFLEGLAIATGGPIWVDEYLHGYKDSDVVTQEVGGAGGWLDYMAKTPWLVLGVQIGLIIGLGLIAQNRRPGVKRTVKPAVVDNSEAYIQAMAGVLHKAASHDFVVDTLTREERLALQKVLGLGSVPVPDTVLTTAWTQSTGQSAITVAVLTQPPPLAHEKDLQAWLGRLAHLRQIHQTHRARTLPHE